MKLIFADAAWDDYLYWQKQDRKMVERINKLIREVMREPFSGVGKPEPLKHCSGQVILDTFIGASGRQCLHGCWRSVAVAAV